MAPGAIQGPGPSVESDTVSLGGDGTWLQAEGQALLLGALCRPPGKPAGRIAGPRPGEPRVEVRASLPG